MNSSIQTWFITGTSLAQARSPEHNKQLVRAAFDAWRAGTGGPFALLAPEASWTIANRSLAAGTYPTRQKLIDVVIAPFNARLSRPLVPTVRGLYADGGTVIAHFDDEATALDGRPYRNHYVWIMKMRDDRIVEVTALFDAVEFDDFWQRVQPRKTRP